jgi:hypothetical protein
MVYPALLPLLPLMRTPRLPVVDWTDAPADLNGLVCCAERRNLVSARVPFQTQSTAIALGCSVRSYSCCIRSSVPSYSCCSIICLVVCHRAFIIPSRLPAFWALLRVPGRVRRGPTAMFFQYSRSPMKDDCCSTLRLATLLSARQAASRGTGFFSFTLSSIA